jgi:hypothetical protein
MTDDGAESPTSRVKPDEMFGGLPVIRITSEDLERLEQSGGDLRETWARRQARLARLEALQSLATAYKEGLEAGGKEEAERRMREKFDTSGNRRPT